MFHFLLVFFLTFSRGHGVEDDLCGVFADYSGAPCRVFSDCPIYDNAEFLYLSHEYPCSRYVVDRPEYRELDLKAFRSIILGLQTTVSPTTIQVFEQVK